MGTPEFAVASLKAVANSGHEVVSVVTNIDEPQGRGLKVVAPPIKTMALSLGLPVIQVSSLRDPDFLDSLRRLVPDLIVVVAFRILPDEVFTIPKFGTFNLHASLLPLYRGAAPINWAIIKGEKETGVTTFILDEKVDTGKVIMQKRLLIGGDETAGELSGRLSVVGAEAVIETIELIRSGRVVLMDQDNARATKAPKIKREDCVIVWSKSASENHNMIRGFSPEPGAFTFLNGRILKIFGSRLTDGHEGLRDGEIVAEGGQLFVGCGDRGLEITELQMEGKRRLSAGEFVRGARLPRGTKLGA